MLKKLISGLGEREPKVQILTDERQALEKAMEQATEKKGEPQGVKVDGKNYWVIDDGYGREIKPA